jgi:hypothetical protein
MTIFSPTPSASNDDALLESGVGSKDGRGCADNDQPYTFGRRPTTAATFPFTPRQFARMLSLRGRVADGLTGADDRDAIRHTKRGGTLFHACVSCGGMVAGAHQSDPSVLCPPCASLGDRDGVARLILATAGLLVEEAA